MRFSAHFQVGFKNIKKSQYLKGIYQQYYIETAINYKLYLQNRLGRTLYLVVQTQTKMIASF